MEEYKKDLDLQNKLSLKSLMRKAYPKLRLEDIEDMSEKDVYDMTGGGKTTVNRKSTGTIPGLNWKVYPENKKNLD